MEPGASDQLADAVVAQLRADELLCDAAVRCRDLGELVDAALRILQSSLGATSASIAIAVPGLPPLERVTAGPVDEGAVARATALELEGEGLGRLEARFAPGRPVTATALESFAACLTMAVRLLDLQRRVRARDPDAGAVPPSSDAFDYAFVWEWDARSLEVTYVSGGAARLLGLTPACWTAPGFVESRLHPRERSRVLDELTRGDGTAVVHRFVAADGTARWLRTRAHRVGGSRVRALSVAVGDDELAERRRGERYAEIVQALGEGVCAVDVAQRVTFINAAGARQLGRLPAELIGRPLCFFLNHSFPDGRVASESSCVLHLSLQHGKPLAAEGMFTRADGSRFHVSVSAAALWRDGAIVGAVLVFNDITARVIDSVRARLLAAAGAIQERLLDYDQTVAELVRVAVPELADLCAIDLLVGGELVHFPALHIDPVASVRLNEWRRTHPPRAGDTLQEVIATRQPVVRAATSDELRAHRPILDELGVVSWAAVPLMARGHVLGALSFGRGGERRPFEGCDLDIAVELGRSTAIAIDNAQLYREAQAAVRLRDDFLMVASHELNTPVAALLLKLERITLAPGGGAAAEAQLAAAQRQALRIKRLVAELLDATQMHLSAATLKLEAVDLGRLAADVVAQQEEQLERAHCHTVLRLDRPVVGRWDPALLERVILNLVTNAIKFATGKPIELRVTSTDGRALLEVQDEGVGMSEAAQARIFERFARAVPAKHYGGMGLGLYICRRIVEAHGGSISVESEPGRGATFRVELPCAGPPTR